MSLFHERMSERAVRAVLLAIVDARQQGADSLEVRHILTGMVRTDPDFVRACLSEGDSVEALLQDLGAGDPVPGVEIGFTAGAKMPDMPRSDAVQRILEEGARLAGERERIDTGHLLEAAIVIDADASALLVAHGAGQGRIQFAREQFAKSRSLFERYSERSKRVIFFARYEAGRTGSSAIGPIHLLLGLLQENGSMVTASSPAETTVESIRADALSRLPREGANVPPSANMPLSGAAKRILAGAAAEAEDRNHFEIGTRHLLLAMFREQEGDIAEVLRTHGIEADRVGENAGEPDGRPDPTRMLNFLRDLGKDGGPAAG